MGRIWQIFFQEMRCEFCCSGTKIMRVSKDRHHPICRQCMEIVEWRNERKSKYLRPGNRGYKAARKQYVEKKLWT